MYGCQGKITWGRDQMIYIHIYIYILCVCVERERENIIMSMVIMHEWLNLQ